MSGDRAGTEPGWPPHAIPVWGVWLESRLAFSTGAGSRKTRNFAANPRCVITTERADPFSSTARRWRFDAP